MTDSLSRNIAISIGLHAGVLILIFFQAVLMPGEPIELRNAIRVDVVGLPEKMKEEPVLHPPPTETKAPEPKAKLPPKEEKAPPAVKLKGPEMPNPKAKKIDTAKAQREALNKLKAQSALEDIKKSLAKEQETQQKSTLVKGNKPIEGSDLTGLHQIDFNRYLKEVEGIIRSRWSIPEWMADAKLRAQVLVQIDERGFIVKKAFQRSSGNVVFDNSVMGAIEASSPLPPPPKRLQGVLESNGIIFNFPE